jgi:iron complex outermembrane receptor protein
LVVAFYFPRSQAQSAAEHAGIVVEAAAEHLALANDFSLSGAALTAGRLSTSDTASLVPGIESARNGGVSSLPVIHGLGDDRIRTLVNGVPVAAACPMHMNPPLSYIDPTNVGQIDVYPGVTPVRLGGDNLGGAILVESAPPSFASAEESFHREGSVSSFYRSNAASIGGAVSMTMASRDISFRYDGSGTRAGDYRAGDGTRINASRFATSNQQLTAAMHRGNNLLEIEAAVQYMPYEGFPNADMDLVENVGEFANVRYRGGYAWGELRISGYYDRIRHQMNGNAPDRFAPAPVDITSMGLMPTRERAQDFGYRINADFAMSKRDTLRIGNELHVQTLDDRWPGAPIGMMFDYVNINDGTRAQVGTFAEWQRQWNAGWTTLLGARDDTVRMNTGPVQGYDGSDPQARAFNASDRSRTDGNIDASLLIRYRPDDQASYGLGLARKNRSPNLYERYAWGTSTIGMVTWFGDGNGYTGNPVLKPETAYAASFTADWHDGSARRWQIKVTPYYTAIQNYIGVVPICGPACSGMPASQLLFANQRARLYGVDATEAYTLADGPRLGVLRLNGTIDFVRGQNLSTHTGLYHMMPLNGTVALEHRRGKWSSALQLHAVDNKTAVDETRLEPTTPGYGILDLRTAYEFGSVRLDCAITNLSDRQYEHPLGGTWQSALYSPGYRGVTFRPLPAAGRSFDIGVAVKF